MVNSPGSRKALVIAWSDLSRDARVSRQVKALSKDFLVDTLALSSSDCASGTSYVLSPQTARGLRRVLRRFFLITRQFERYYWSTPAVVRAMKNPPAGVYNLIVANDIDTLPFALKLARENGARVLFDAHEFSPSEFDEKVIFRLFVRPYKDYLCRKYLARSHAMTTVSPGLAERYKSDYSVQPLVVYNAPDYHPRIRNLQNPEEHSTIRTVHHGIGNPTRKIEAMIEGVRSAGPRYTLDLYLVPTDEKYLRFLKDSVKDCDRIKIHPPVKIKEIIPTLAVYDVGLCVFPPSSFNQRYCLPNKFFDFIQARLPVLISPLPALESLTKNYNIGWIASGCSSEAIAQTLSQIKIESVKAKAGALDVAAKELCFDKSESVLMGVVNGMLHGK